jgi:predicted nucleic acid-binding protein
MVLVDTPVWSLSLRRRAVDLTPADRRVTQNLYDLVRQKRVKLLGSTRQEVLSGIREESQFLRIRDHLRGFRNVELDLIDYEDAAQASNRCSSRGIAGSHADFLMCAVAVRYGWQIFSTDRDFERYSGVLPIQLFLPS